MSSIPPPILEFRGKQVNVSPYTPSIFKMALSMFPPQSQDYILDNWNKSLEDPQCERVRISLGGKEMMFKDFLVPPPPSSATQTPPKRVNESSTNQFPSKVPNRSPPPTHLPNEPSISNSSNGATNPTSANLPTQEMHPLPIKYTKFKDLKSDSINFEDPERQFSESMSMGYSDEESDGESSGREYMFPEQEDDVYESEEFSDEDQQDYDDRHKMGYYDDECDGHAYGSYGFIVPHEFPYRCTEETKAKYSPPPVIKCKSLNDFVEKMKSAKAAHLAQQNFTDGSNLYDTFDNIEGQTDIYHIPLSKIGKKPRTDDERLVFFMRGYTKESIMNEISAHIRKLEEVYPFSRNGEHKWACIDKLHESVNVHDYASCNRDRKTTSFKKSYCKGELSVVIYENTAAIRHYHRHHPTAKAPRDPVKLLVANKINNYLAEVVPDDTFPEFIEKLSAEVRVKPELITEMVKDITENRGFMAWK